MKLLYNDVDISDKVKINKCVHDMFCEGKSDQITIKFSDNDGLWDQWNPQTGDTIAISEDYFKSGTMNISSIKPTSGELTIKALSMPVSGLFKENRAWEAIRFYQLCDDIAFKHGLSIKYYGVEDRVFDYIEQINQTDFEFLNSICVLEGNALLIYNNALVIYNQSYMESQNVLDKVMISKKDSFEYIDESALTFGSCEVRVGKFYGRFNYGNGNTFEPSKSLRVNSDAEAARFAKSVLRDINKNRVRGWFTKGTLLEFAPGSVLQINTEQNISWDGKIYITRMRNDYLRKESKVFFRKPLEGY